MPSMIESIVMRKCNIPYKEARKIITIARQQLQFGTENSRLLWSKEYEAACMDEYNKQQQQQKLLCDTSNGTTVRIGTPEIEIPKQEPVSTRATGSSRSVINKKVTIQRRNSDTGTDGFKDPISNAVTTRRQPGKDVTRKKSRSLSKPRRKSIISTDTTAGSCKNDAASTTAITSENRDSSTIPKINSYRPDNDYSSQQRQQSESPRRMVVRRTSSSNESIGNRNNNKSPMSLFVSSASASSAAAAAATTRSSTPPRLPNSNDNSLLSESMHSSSTTSPRKPTRKLSFNDRNESTAVVVPNRRINKNHGSFSSQSCQTTDAVIVADTDDDCSNRYDRRGRGRGREPKPRVVVSPTAVDRSRSKSIAQRRNPKISPNHETDNDTVNATSSVFTSSRSILRNKSTSNRRRTDDPDSISLSPIAKSADRKKSPTAKANRGSCFQENDNSFISQVQRLHRSLSFLQDQETENKMYTLPRPLTPTESVKPKLQLQRSMKQNDQRQERSSNVETTPEDKGTIHLLRPRIKKLTLSDENFFDSFRRNVQPVSTRTTNNNESKRRIDCTPSNQRDIEMKEKSRRSSTTDITNRNLTYKAHNDEFSDPPFVPIMIVSPTKTKKVKSISRRRLSVAELEKECQADPTLLDMIAASKNKTKSNNIIDRNDLPHSSNRSSPRDGNNKSERNEIVKSFQEWSIDHNPEQVPDNERITSNEQQQPKSSLASFIGKDITKEAKGDGNQTVSTGSGSSKSKTRMVPVINTKSRQIDAIPMSTKKAVIGDNVPVSPSKRNTMVSPLGKKSAIAKPTYESPISMNRRMMAHNNSCYESPLSSHEKDKSFTIGDKVSMSPSKLQMIPVVHKSPTQRMSTRSIKLNSKQLDSEERCHATELHQNIISPNMKKPITIESPLSTTIDKHSVTSRTSHTTATTKSSNSDTWFPTITKGNDDLPTFTNYDTEQDSFVFSGIDTVREGEIFPEFAPSRSTVSNESDDENTNANLIRNHFTEPEEYVVSSSSMLDETNTSENNNNNITANNNTGAPKLPQRRRSTTIPSH